MVSPNRRALASGAALLALSGAAVATKSAPNNLGGMFRSRFGSKATGTDPRDVGTIPLPKAGMVYLLPLSTTLFSESSDVTLLPDGKVLVNNAGLYRVCAGVDWPGRYGTDSAIRKANISRERPNTPLRTRLDEPTGMLQLLGGYERLAAADIPGSAVPIYSRASAPWPGAPVPPRGSRTMDVTVPGTVMPGDAAWASLDCLTELLPGLDNLRISARVIGPSLVRVYVDNIIGDNAVDTPAGNLNVLAGTTTITTGRSTDAWACIQSPAIDLAAGDKLMLTARSDCPGDFIQVTNHTYLQIERWG